MPSPRSPRPAPPTDPRPRTSRGGRAAAAAALSILLVAAALGCASRGPAAPAPPPPGAPEPGVAAEERPYLLDPVARYPGDLDPDLGARVGSAHERLIASGDPVPAAAAAAEVLAEAPDFAPATVLAAQAALVAGDPAGALERVQPVAGRYPRWPAALLLAGRAAERSDDVPEAYAAFLSVSEVSDLAAERAAELEPRALEIVGRRFADALERERWEAAGDELARLQLWAPDADRTLEATADLAAARGDRQSELLAVDRLLARRPDDRALQERRAELDLAVGDPSRGLETLRELAALHPDDRELADKLERAKFRWRITLLPGHVQAVPERAELTRADLAVLLYWLVPEVRYARPSGATIAQDILEHPRREELTRAVNLGLLEVDPTLHTASPDRAARRATALAALLRVLRLAGADGCLDGASLGRRPSAGAVCAAAARCRIVADAAACAPQATLSGDTAIELVRRTLEQMPTE